MRRPLAVAVAGAAVAVLAVVGALAVAARETGDTDREAVAVADAPRPADATTTTEPPPHLLAVGDLASCVRSEDEAVAALLAASSGTIAGLGDHAYDVGSTADFAECFLPSFGSLLPRWRPAVGNHEYEQPGAAPYHATFGDLAGDLAEGWYSYGLGAWHVVVLDTNCGKIGGCDLGSKQYDWLRSDLAPGHRCLLAYGHHPVATSTPDSRWDIHRPLLEQLRLAGLDVHLAGHAHNYERFARIGPDGTADAEGFRAFVVGTGGASAYDFDDVLPTSEVRETGTFGVLDLELRPDGYSWAFRHAAGRPFTDSGSGTC